MEKHVNKLHLNKQTRVDNEVHLINIVIPSTKEASTLATIQSIMFLIDILWSIIIALVKMFIEEHLNQESLTQ